VLNDLIHETLLFRLLLRVVPKNILDVTSQLSRDLITFDPKIIAGSTVIGLGHLWDSQLVFQWRWMPFEVGSRSYSEYSSRLWVGTTSGIRSRLWKCFHRQTQVGDCLMNFLSISISSRSFISWGNWSRIYHV
jgi:hypothetical protein